MCGARSAVEVGTAIGVSTLHIARALAEGGTVISFEVDAGRQEAARGYLERAGLADRVDLRLKDGAEGLEELDRPVRLRLSRRFKADYPRHWSSSSAAAPRWRRRDRQRAPLRGRGDRPRHGHWSEEDVLRMRELQCRSGS